MAETLKEYVEGVLFSDFIQNLFSDLGKSGEQSPTHH
jgi:hypothetical protein